jgi:hypothetical protein
MASRSRPPRRGVVLLVILSLLVLFALLGVTFVIVSGQYKRSAQSYMRAEMYGDDWVRQIDTGMYVALRDTLDPANVLRSHSLFNDLYGHNTCYGTVTGAPTNAGGGQLMSFNCTIYDAANNVAPDQAGYFNGCVLTFFRPMDAGNNRLAGNSTRIIGSASTSGTATLRIMRPTADDANDVVLNVGDRFIINGRPFSGTGAGFNPNSGNLDYKTGNAEEALFPVRLDETIADLGANYLRGGGNENWDACDLQNLFLSATIPDASNAVGIKMGMNGTTPYYHIIPSFHRPALYQYMQNKGLTSPADVRKYCFRPMPGVTASANFPPLASPIYGPWDVDNDGDGVADSIWVDLNMPVQTSPDGRRYKPLFAIKIADLDNRLQLNYHGNEQHYSPAGVKNGYYMADGSQTSVNPLKGVGLGPAEVALGTDAVNNVGIVGLSSTIYKNVLEGDGTRYGRYGQDKVPGSGVAISAAADPISATRFFEIPANYFGGGSPGSYQGPPDFVGQLARAVDPRGQLVTDVPTDTTSDLRARAVYRTRVGSDTRFTPVEFERILRYYDLDVAQTPDRLERLATILSGGSAAAAFNRQIVTTEGRDMPIAPAVATKGINAQNTSNKTGFRDAMALLRKRASLSETDLLSVVDRDFYFGLKMNLNRPLGDAVDRATGANAVIDEHETYFDRNGDGTIDEKDFPETYDAFQKGIRLVNGEDMNNDGTVNTQDDALARQQLAKHLYVLASLCTDTTGMTPDTDHQRQLAQWAINVVDFRDSDSIMTPFEYDPNPFDGWNSNCDGIIGAYDATRPVVWGLERPELLLTETLVTHDRRTSDTADEDPVDPNEGDMQKMKGLTTDDAASMKKDGSFDQKYLPEGSAFIELYNPWQSSVERVPAEFYYQWAGTGAGWKTGVCLDQTTPDGGSPVWRILVVKDIKNVLRDPDEQDTDVNKRIADGDKERTVYFTNPTGKVDASETTGTPYYPGHAIAPVLPGRYAVIGSGPVTGIGTPPKYVTYFGFKSDPPDPTTHTAAEMGATRRIELQPSVDPTVNQVRIMNNQHSTQPEPNYTTPTTQPAVAVVLTKSTNGDARFSLSEPVGGYSVVGTPQADTGLALLNPVLDVPLDNTGDNKTELMKKGMSQQFRSLHLQRLANPLIAHNKITNPYLTIDSTAADLVCFNGLTPGAEPKVTDASIAFETLQRGDPPTAANPTRQLWKRTMSQNLTAKDDDATHIWPYNLHHTLGYLNSAYGQYATADSGGVYKGDPTLGGGMQPFPWLTFNNRPFNSVYELMEVPQSKPSQLTSDYKIPATLNSPYSQDATNQDYGHLINFYYDTAGGAATQISGMHRIFDYLRVPSKYVEADTMLVAANFADLSPLAQNAFHPPFNWLSNYRDPGMVNVNTIYSVNVWNALLGGDPRANPNLGLGPTFDQILASRRGYEDSTGNNDILYRKSDVPTEIAAPFRAAGSGKFPTTGNEMNPTEDINCTLLRKDTIATHVGADPAASNLPLLGNNNSQAYNNSARNPYFRHQSLQRLSNVLTTRSNVYACWVTIGYFEVDNSGSLGQELNSDTGEIKRHRAFYMIDRSIPVGFEAGENHNVDRAILVRRYIE